MAFKLKSLLPTISVSLPAIITGILIFTENKFDPLKSLFSKSEEELKKEEEENKGKEDGEKNAKGEKGKNKKSEKGEGSEQEQKSDLEGKGENNGQDTKDSKVQDNDLLGDSEKESGGGKEKLDSFEGSSNETVEGQKENEKPLGDGEESLDSGEDTAKVIGAGETDGEAKERTGSKLTGKGRKWAGAFEVFFGDINEDLFDE